MTKYKIYFPAPKLVTVDVGLQTYKAYINPVMKGKNIQKSLASWMKNLLVRLFLAMLLLSVGHIVIEF